jgi:hypothetical protein
VPSRDPAIDLISGGDIEDEAGTPEKPPSAAAAHPSPWHRPREMPAARMPAANRRSTIPAAGKRIFVKVSLL